MKIGINCGHTLSGAGSGVVGIFKESEHTRHVGYALMERFQNAGVNVINCTIDSAATQSQYLQQVVELANCQDLDWFISIHFNASKTHTGHGVEVYTYKGRQYPDAMEVCKNLASIGFTNRGVKEGSGLYVIRKTRAKSMLIEVCFCDSQEDTELYVHATLEKVVQAIFMALYDYTVTPEEGNETAIMGVSIATVDQLTSYLLKHNPNAENYSHLAKLFIDEGSKEGVRGDIAFCQACKETGYFKFGGDVSPDQHNYAGLGATGGVPGLIFANDQIGVRAQIQHLKAYASTQPLILPCIDPRYSFVTKGCAATIERLSGKWAVPGYSTDRYTSFAEAWEAQDTYGHNIVDMLKEACNLQPQSAITPDYFYVVSICDVWTKAEADAYSATQPGSKVHKVPLKDF